MDGSNEITSFDNLIELMGAVWTTGIHLNQANLSTWQLVLPLTVPARLHFHPPQILRIDRPITARQQLANTELTAETNQAVFFFRRQSAPNIRCEQSWIPHSNFKNLNRPA